MLCAVVSGALCYILYTIKKYMKYYLRITGNRITAEFTTMPFILIELTQNR